MFVFSFKHAPFFLFLSPRVRRSFIKGEFVVFAKSADLSSTAQKMNSSFCSGSPPPPPPTPFLGISSHVGMCSVFTPLPTKV